MDSRILHVRYPEQTSGSNPMSGSRKWFNVVAVENEWDAERGDRENQIMKLRIIVQGKVQPQSLKKLVLDFSETERQKDLSAVQVYAAGKTSLSGQCDLLYAGPAVE